VSGAHHDRSSRHARARDHYSAATEGLLVTPAQQPGCTPGLQAALSAHVARLGARLREAKKFLSAWLPGNAARVRFPGVRRRIPRGDFAASRASAGWLARARAGR
jgi:hypothetical protein